MTKQPNSTRTIFSIAPCRGTPRVLMARVVEHSIQYLGEIMTSGARGIASGCLAAVAFFWWWAFTIASY